MKTQNFNLEENLSKAALEYLEKNYKVWDDNCNYVFLAAKNLKNYIQIEEHYNRYRVFDKYPFGEKYEEPIGKFEILQDAIDFIMI